MEHGYAKIARGPAAFTKTLHALGTPAPSLLSLATILVELLGGLAVLLGAFVPLASIPMSVVLLVAIFPFICPRGSVRSSCYSFFQIRPRAKPKLAESEERVPD
jgi:putative oxidoreductase